MIMITEKYVSFETAKLLKEKGFDGECHSYYFPYYEDREMTKKNYERQRGRVTSSNKRLYEVNTAKDLPEDHYLCPTLQMVVAWLWEEKGFLVFPSLDIDYDEDENGVKYYHKPLYWGNVIRTCDGEHMYDDGKMYDKPEYAMDAAVKYCVENLI